MYMWACVRIIYSLTEDKPFEYFILTTIFVNCILLAANTPLPNSDKSDLNIKLVSIHFPSFVIVFSCSRDDAVRSFCGHNDYYTWWDEGESLSHTCYYCYFPRKKPKYIY